MRSISLIALAALATVATPVLASQGPVNATDFTASVEHKDLDLTSSKDVSRLDDRIRTRINQMCRNGGRDSASVRLERQCRVSALAAVKSDVRFAIAKANAQRARFATSAASNASSGV